MKNCSARLPHRTTVLRGLRQPAVIVSSGVTRRAGRGIDKALYRPYKGSMKTLTITDAKKNLSRWLDAAARGQDIGIVRGAEIIALRRVEVESTDYAQREYATTPEQIAAFAAATDKRYRRLKRSGKLVTVSTEQLRNLLE